MKIHKADLPDVGELTCPVCQCAGRILGEDDRGTRIGHTYRIVPCRTTRTGLEAEVVLPPNTVNGEVVTPANALPGGST